VANVDGTTITDENEGATNSTTDNSTNSSNTSKTSSSRAPIPSTATTKILPVFEKSTSTTTQVVGPAAATTIITPGVVQEATNEEPARAESNGLLFENTPNDNIFKQKPDSLTISTGVVADKNIEMAEGPVSVSAGPEHFSIATPTAPEGDIADPGFQTTSSLVAAAAVVGNDDHLKAQISTQISGEAADAADRSQQNSAEMESQTIGNPTFAAPDENDLEGGQQFEQSQLEQQFALVDVANGQMQNMQLLQQGPNTGAPTLEGPPGNPNLHAVGQQQFFVSNSSFVAQQEQPLATTVDGQQVYTFIVST